MHVASIRVGGKPAGDLFLLAQFIGLDIEKLRWRNRSFHRRQNSCRRIEHLEPVFDLRGLFGWDEICFGHHDPVRHRHLPGWLERLVELGQSVLRIDRRDDAVQALDAK